MTLATISFKNFLRVHLWTMPENELVKFEVHIFDHVTDISI